MHVMYPTSSSRSRSDGAFDPTDRRWRRLAHLNPHPSQVNDGSAATGSGRPAPARVPCARGSVRGCPRILPEIGRFGDEGPVARGRAAGQTGHGAGSRGRWPACRWQLPEPHRAVRGRRQVSRAPIRSRRIVPFARERSRPGAGGPETVPTAGIHSAPPWRHPGWSPRSGASPPCSRGSPRTRRRWWRSSAARSRGGDPDSPCWPRGARPTTRRSTRSISSRLRLDSSHPWPRRPSTRFTGGARTSGTRSPSASPSRGNHPTSSRPSTAPGARERSRSR